MADIKAIREFLEPQKCARGHPPMDMMNTKQRSHGTLGQKSTATMIYTCPTCNRKLNYEATIGRVKDMTVVYEGDIDPEKANYPPNS